MNSYKKPYNIVSHEWVADCLHMFGVAENIKTLLVKGTLMQI